MKSNFLFKLSVAILSVFIVALITLSVLGSKERVGYITDFKSIEESSGSSNLVYSMRIRYYDKVFRNSDIYGVYVATNNLPDYLTSISFEKSGSPYGKVLSTKDISYDERIDISYKLKIKLKTFLTVFSVLIFLLSIIFVLTNYLKKIKSMLYTCSKKILSIYKLLTSKNFLAVYSSSFTFSLIVIVILTIFYSLNNSGWLFGDDHEYLTTTVQGQMDGLSIWGSRFFPLGHFHNNLLIPFGNNPFAYLALSIVFFIGFVSFLYFTIFSYSKKHYISAILTIFMLLMPDVLHIYFQIIFPETTILFLIAIFAFFYRKSLNTNKTVYYIVCSVSALLATYYKEPIFGLFLVFSLTQILFNYKNLTKKQKGFLYFLIVNAIVFVILYLWSTKNATSNYAEGRDWGLGRIGILKLFLKTHILFTISILIAFIRAFYILIKKDKTLIIFDAYIFSGIAYTFAYIILKLVNTYYLIPSYICYILAFSGYITYMLNTQKLKNSNCLKQLFNIFMVLITIITFLSEYPKITNQLNNIVVGRKDTIWQTKLVLNLEDAGYEIYIYYPKEMVGFPRNVQGWREYVINVFASVERNNGRYIPDYKPLKNLKDGDTINANNKTIILYDKAYKINYENIAGIKTNNSKIYNSISIIGLGNYIQNDTENQFESILNKTREKYFKKK